MNRFPKEFLRLWPNIVYIAAMPVCFLIAVLLYEPKGLCELMHTAEGTVNVQSVYSFNIAITTAILLVAMTAVRLPLYFLRRRIDQTMTMFCFRCTAELVILCAFEALYLVLMDKTSAGYFAFLGRSLSALGSVLLIPYIILSLWYCLKSASEEKPMDEGSRLKFYDNRHQLKFVTSAGAVLYIESNENYVVIHYLENGIEKRFQLRNSMKSIEPLCERAGFARTHRCFIVNPAHIKTIRKESGQNFAELGCERAEGIPISKKYHDSIASML